MWERVNLLIRLWLHYTHTNVQSHPWTIDSNVEPKIVICSELDVDKNNVNITRDVANVLWEIYIDGTRHIPDDIIDHDHYRRLIVTSNVENLHIEYDLCCGNSSTNVLYKITWFEQWHIFRRYTVDTFALLRIWRSSAHNKYHKKKVLKNVHIEHKSIETKTLQYQTQLFIVSLNCKFVHYSMAASQPTNMNTIQIISNSITSGAMTRRPPIQKHTQHTYTQHNLLTMAIASIFHSYIATFKVVCCVCAFIRCVSSQ